MPNIDPKVITHYLNMDSKFKLVRQNRRSYNQERYFIVKVEDEKPLKSRYITELYYPK